MGALFEMKRPAVLFKGKRYRLDLAYDVVLLVQQLYEEEDLENEDKINQALKLLVRSRFRVWLLNDLERAKLLEQITREHISSKRRARTSSHTKLMDFCYDEAYIYASFRQAYGIDLAEENGRLSWRKYIDLLDGLPDKTKLKEVMRIRAMEIPAPTRTNRKEIQNIMELKSYYALPVKGGGGQDGLNLLFDTLEKGAKRV